MFRNPLFTLDDYGTSYWPDGTPYRPDGNTYRPDGECGFCRRPSTPAGHDPCIPGLPGVLFACCGHRKTTPFVTMARAGGPTTEEWFFRLVAKGADPGALLGETISGDEALTKMRDLGGSPATG